MRRTQFGSRAWTGQGGSPSPIGHALAAILYPVKLLVHVGLIGIAVASFAPLLGDRFPPLATFEAFFMQITAVSLPLGLLALCFRPRWFAILGPLVFAWNIGTVWPYLPLHKPDGLLADGAVADARSGADPSLRLKVVSANVWYRNDSTEAAIRYIEATDADVVALIELTPQWHEAMQPLYARYPYRVDCMSSRPPCEMLLMSKYPFERTFAGRIDGRAPVIAWGDIRIGGRKVTVAATHLSWPLRAEMLPEDIMPGDALQPPLPDSYPLVQSQQASALAQYLNGLGPDLVLMGDFNSVPWSRTQNALRAATGLKDPGPMVPSWPSWQPGWNRIPIDHVMIRGALSRLEFRRGRYIGSDHMPVEAQIAVMPE